MIRETIDIPDGGVSRMAGMVTGVRAGDLLFFSAMRGRNPETNASSDDAYEQAAQALRNLRIVLESRGSRMRDVVKVTVYLSEGVDLAPFDVAWEECFSEDAPARTVLHVADASATPSGKAHFVLDVIAKAR